MSSYRPENPLIVQADRTVLLEVNNPRYEAARDALAAFAELERSPEHVHTYRITPLSLWNAAAAGHDESAILGSLREFSKYDLPSNLVADVQDYVAQVGQGAIADRAHERLGRSDVGVILLRQIWARELQALAEGRPLKQWVCPEQLSATTGV